MIAADLISIKFVLLGSRSYINFYPIQFLFFSQMTMGLTFTMLIVENARLDFNEIYTGLIKKIFERSLFGTSSIPSGIDTFQISLFL